MLRDSGVAFSRDTHWIHLTLIYILVNKRINTKTFFKYIFMLNPKQLFIIIYVNVIWQTITSCSVTEKFRKVNLPSHDRIRHLNYMRSLTVLSTKVNNLPFWKFAFYQERRCHGSVKMTVSERWVWFKLDWLSQQAVADHFNVSKVTPFQG